MMANYTTLLRDISDEEVPPEVGMFYRVAASQNSRVRKDIRLIVFIGYGAYEKFLLDFPEIVPYLGELEEDE